MHSSQRASCVNSCSSAPSARKSRSLSRKTRCQASIASGGRIKISPCKAPSSAYSSMSSFGSMSDAEPISINLWSVSTSSSQACVCL